MDLDEAKVPELFVRAMSERISTLSEVRLLESVEGPGHPIPALWLEKSWWNVHAFLTARDAACSEEVDKPSLFSRAILGGKPLGDELQQGPARYLWADEVREIAAALSSQTREELLRCYRDPSGRMSAAYDAAMRRGLSDGTLDEETFDWLVREVDVLASYYGVAAGRANAMLLGLT